MGNSYNVLVQNGYCEDSNNGWLWLNLESEKKLSNQKVWAELADTLRACATLSVEKSKHADCSDIPEGAAFCSQCGISAKQAKWWKDEEGQDLNDEAARIVKDLQSMRCCSVKQEWVEIFESRGWSIWGRPVNGRMVFISSPDRGLEGYENFPEIESKRVTFR